MSPPTNQMDITVNKNVKSTVNKNHFTFGIMSLTSFLSTPVYWERLTQTCRETMERGARHAGVFQQLSAMQLVETYRDVEAILLDSNVRVYFGRFVVFINWLHRHRRAYDFWRHLVQDHSERLTKAICELAVA